jgi:hypothetical protein
MPGFTAENPPNNALVRGLDANQNTKNEIRRPFLSLLTSFF